MDLTEKKMNTRDLGSKKLEALFFLSSKQDEQLGVLAANMMMGISNRHATIINYMEIWWARMIKHWDLRQNMMNSWDLTEMQPANNGF